MHIITSLRDGGAESVLFRLCTNDNENQHIVVSLLVLYVCKLYVYL